MRFFLFFLFFSLAACARESTVSEDVFTGIHNEIGELAQQLPKECKTDVINAKISDLSARTALAQKSTSRDLKDCESKARLWRFRFFALAFGVIAVVLLVIYRKVVKKIL